MKEPSKNTNCAVDITILNPRKSRSKNYDTTSAFVLFITVLLAAGTMTYILYRARQTETHLTGVEVRKLVQAILLENNELYKSTVYVAEIQVLDKNYRLLWFKRLDEETLKDEEHAEKEIQDEFEDEKDEIVWDPPALIRHARNADSPRTREYVVSHQTQFVNCDHFKPIPRGKYLVPPSLHALHTCYQYGVTMNELASGILRKEGGDLRYNLQELYVACHDVFNDQMDELTSELRNDYERCKWSGALDDSQQRIIEERFAPYFVPSNAPSNLEATSRATTTLPSAVPTTASPVRLDPRAYVECSHVETELFEDSFESPSPEALQRCHKFGVTYDELRRGIARNPQPEQMRLDVGNLYVPCQDVFDGSVDYMTNELKDDYRRCKRMWVLSKETQTRLERKFYEALYDENDPPSRRTERPTTTITTTTTTTEITTTTSEELEQQTTTIANRPAFANNCKRVENKDFYICIKVITSYNSPMINV